jgi:hypothetical protein
MLSSILLLALVTVSSLGDIGRDIQTLHIRGTASVTGQQNVSGVPFDATIAAGDSCRFTMSGPLGITLARMWATPTDFVYVNYVEQEVIDGSPDAQAFADLTPLNLTATQFLALISGSIPGDPSRFTVTNTQQPSGSLLYRAFDSAHVEYVLIDTVHGTLQQYQRKDSSGQRLLNVSFSDHREISSHWVPGTVTVVMDDRRQTMRLRLDDVRVNAPITSPMRVDIPPTFRRTTLK